MKDACHVPGLMPFEQAKQRLLNAAQAIKSHQTLAIEQADKRVLAEAIYSPINVPNHDNSAMDGYALCDDNIETDSALTIFTLVGTAFAGAPFTGHLKHGECVRIMTGGVVPKGANTVIMQEQVSEISNQVGAQIEITTPCKLHSHIRFAGEDMAKGQCVFAAGYQLKAVDLGLLASLGTAQVKVLNKLKVAVFSTGDELTEPGQPLEPGAIYESNSQVLIAMLERMGFDVLAMGIIPDTLADIEQALIQADQNADAVISSGGVSVGDADHVKTVLEKLGQVDFWRIAMKPGKPFAFGQLANSLFFGLPGNPVSAAVTFDQLAKPALLAMAGAKETKPLRLTAIATKAIRKAPGRMDFQRAIAEVTPQGLLQVTPLPAQGSGILSSISKANCYLILSAENNGHPAGASVTIELFDEVIG